MAKKWEVTDRDTRKVCGTFTTEAVSIKEGGVVVQKPFADPERLAHQLCRYNNECSGYYRYEVVECEYEPAKKAE